MTRSRHSRKGYFPTQKAGHDSPWLMENKRRTDDKQEADAECERCLGTGWEPDDLDMDYPDGYGDTPKMQRCSNRCPDPNTIYDHKALYPNILEELNAPRHEPTDN